MLTFPNLLTHNPPFTLHYLSIMFVLCSPHYSSYSSYHHRIEDPLIISDLRKFRPWTTIIDYLKGDAPRPEGT